MENQIVNDFSTFDKLVETISHFRRMMTKWNPEITFESVNRTNSSEIAIVTIPANCTELLNVCSLVGMILHPISLQDEVAHEDFMRTAGVYNPVPLKLKFEGDYSHVWCRATNQYEEVIEWNVFIYEEKDLKYFLP